MRVLMISPKVSGIGGVAQHVSSLMGRLRGMGFNVDYISTENTVHIPVKGLYNPSFSFSSFWKGLYRRVLGVEYDVVHAHNVPSWFCLKASRGRIKVLTQHGVYSQQISFLHGGFFGYIGGRLERYALKRVDAVTCISKSVYEYYRGIGVNAFYIPNAIDFNDLPSDRVRFYDRQVVFIGRVSLEKGVDTLIKSLEYLGRDVHVLIIGSGTRDMESLINSHVNRHPNLHFLGYKPRSECLKILAGSDALVLPSRFEGMPTVLLEAMALKIPIIATRIPGVLDVVDDSCAILIQPDNPKALAEAINNCLSGYPEEYISNAYERVKVEFNWDAVSEKYVKLYMDLLHGKGF
jgi:glycosyltransferase involved in cell wall biosynthesis